MLKLNFSPLFTSFNFLLHSFKYFKTRILCNSRINKIIGNVAIIESQNREKLNLPFDKVIVATGYESYKPYENITYSKNIHYIGDANHVGNLMTAISDAYEVAYNILLK